MSHILREKEAWWTHKPTRPYAAIRVRVLKYRPRILVIDPDHEKPIVIVKTDVLMVPLPEDVQVQSPDGEVCEASGRFFISTETLDPYHLVLDDHQGVMVR